MILTSRIRVVGVMALVALLSFEVGSLAQARFADMNGAEGSLQNAIGQLQHARDIFGGHRVNAIGLCNQAISEIEAGKQFAVQSGYWRCVEGQRSNSVPFCLLCQRPDACAFCLTVLGSVKL